MKIVRSRVSGMTIIELVTVMAIIGVFASVTIAGLGEVRKRSQAEASAAAMETARAGAKTCLYVLGNITQPTDNAVLCTEKDNLRWPTLAGKWEYSNTFDAGDPTDGTFSFSASDGTDTISCDESECTHS